MHAATQEQLSEVGAARFACVYAEALSGGNAWTRTRVKLAFGTELFCSWFPEAVSRGLPLNGTQDEALENKINLEIGAIYHTLL